MQEQLSPKKSHRRAWIAVAAVAFLVIGGGGVTWYLVQDKDVPPPASPGVILQAPPTLGGRQPASTTETTRLEKVMTSALSDPLAEGFGVPIAKSYGDFASESLVIVGAVTTGLDPITAKVGPIMPINWFLKAATFGQTTVNAVNLDPGWLGGRAHCLTAWSAPFKPVALCAWTDAHSVGIVYFPNTGVVEAAKEFISLREQVEQRQ